jgi:hypothetical protein
VLTSYSIGCPAEILNTKDGINIVAPEQQLPLSNKLLETGPSCSPREAVTHSAV